MDPLGGRRAAPGDQPPTTRQVEVAQALDLVSIVAVPLIADGRRLGRAHPVRGPAARRVHRGRRRGRRAARAAAVARRGEGPAVRARRADLAHPAGQPAAARRRRRWPGSRRRCATWRRPTASRSAGDFYDVVQLPNGHVALAVGDVVGHDITAAATMGQLNSVYRALLADRPSPSSMIDRLQASWSLLGLQRMATALFATLDPATGQLRVASAGHLPPLLITDGARGVPAGGRRAGCWGRRRRPRRRSSGPAWCRSAPRWCCSPTGWWRAGRPTSTRGSRTCWPPPPRAGTSDPDELCDRLLADLTGAHRADDIALLALTRLG